jgi:integrase
MAKSITTSVGFLFREIKINQAGTLYINVRHYDKKMRWALRDLVMLKEDYEKVSKGGRRLSPELSNMKLRIEAYKSKAQNITCELGEDFTFERFSDLFFNKKKILSRQAKFSDIVREYLENNELQIQTQRGYLTMLSKVRKYHPNLSISQITDRFLNDFKQYLTEDVSPSTITIYFRYVKAIWRYASRIGLVSAIENPFQGIRLASIVQRKRALCEEDIRKLKIYSKQNVGYTEAIDYFLISFYGNGMNFKDLLMLRDANFKNGYIEFVRAKTKNSVTRDQKVLVVRLSHELENLIRKRGKINSTEHVYIFPVLNENMDEKERQRAIDQCIQRTNKDLKRVGEYLGLPIKLTTYVARHSFASILAHKTNNPYMVQGLIGHSTVKQTETYISSLDTTAADTAASILEAI